MGGRINLGNGIYLVPIDLSRIDIISNDKSIEPDFLNNEIVSLKLSNNFSLTKFFPINLNNGQDIFKPRYFEKISDTHYIAYREKPTISSMFILPLLIDYEKIGPIMSNILNLYTYMEETLDSKNVYNLVTRYSSTPIFLKYENIINNSINCKGIIDIDPYYISFVFEAPDQFLFDIELIKNGKYSAISREAKETIYGFYTHPSRMGTPLILERLKIYKILEREIEYKKFLEKDLGVTIPPNVDLYEGFNDSRETYLKSMKVDVTEDIGNKSIIKM